MMDRTGQGQMVYAGKHGRHGASGDVDGRRRTRRPTAAALGPDISVDMLKAEDACDDNGSQRRMQHLLRSIHVRGIRLQSPVYIENSRRSRVNETRGPGISAAHGTAGTRQDMMVDSWPDSSVTRDDSMTTWPVAMPVQRPATGWRDSTIPLVKVREPLR